MAQKRTRTSNFERLCGSEACSNSHFVRLCGSEACSNNDLQHQVALVREIVTFPRQQARDKLEQFRSARYAKSVDLCIDTKIIRI